MNFDVVVGSAIGAASICFLVWGVGFLARGLARSRREQEEITNLRIYGAIYGVDHQPGERPEEYRARITDVVENVSRYPREPG